LQTGTDLSRWHDDEISGWIQSVAARYELSVGTVMQVRTKCKAGTQLLALDGATLEGPVWR
jgi:hypothetical protein